MRIIMHPQNYWFSYPLLHVGVHNMAKDKYKITGLMRDVKRK